MMYVILVVIMIFVYALLGKFVIILPNDHYHEVYKLLPMFICYIPYLTFS